MLVEVLRVLLYVVFILTSLLLIVIILLQESKGGGLAAAFGGAGAETFGVKAGGINRFTALLAAIFVGCAIILAALQPRSAAPPSDKPAPAAPADPGDAGEGGAPADTGGGEGK